MFFVSLQSDVAPFGYQIEHHVSPKLRDRSVAYKKKSLNIHYINLYKHKNDTIQNKHEVVFKKKSQQKSQNRNKNLAVDHASTFQCNIMMSALRMQVNCARSAGCCWRPGGVIAAVTAAA